MVFSLHTLCVSLCECLHFSVYVYLIKSSNSTGSSGPVDSHLMELCVTAVKFARKQGNIALASRMLGQCCEPPAEHPEGGDLVQSFRMLSLDGPVKEKWGPELEIERAKVLFTAGQWAAVLFSPLSLSRLSPSRLGINRIKDTVLFS